MVSVLSAQSCVCKHHFLGILSNTYLYPPRFFSEPLAGAAFCQAVIAFLTVTFSRALPLTQALAWSREDERGQSGFWWKKPIAHESPPHCQSIWTTVHALGPHWPTSMPSHKSKCKLLHVALTKQTSNNSNREGALNLKTPPSQQNEAPSVEAGGADSFWADILPIYLCDSSAISASKSVTWEACDDFFSKQWHLHSKLNLTGDQAYGFSMEFAESASFSFSL